MKSRAGSSLSMNGYSRTPGPAAPERPVAGGQAEEVRRRAQTINEPRDIWALHDFLSDAREETDEKYDYRYSVLVFLFPRLIREGWLSEAELEGLAEPHGDGVI